MELYEKLWGRIQNREFPELALELGRLQGLRLEDILNEKGVENERDPIEHVEPT